MKISQIFKNYPAKITIDEEISSICFNIEDVCSGSMFFCLNNGETAEFLIKNAVFNGAKVVVCQEEIDTKANLVVVNNCRKALSVASRNFYGYENKTKIIGVVGTNGKTTTSNIIKQLLIAGGKRVGSICTHQAEFEGEVTSTDMTTPDPPQLFKLINQMEKNGAEYIVMEVSAHAIYFYKCFAIKFEYLVFTNCSQDHLDFFKDLQRYKNVKQSIFTQENCKNAIINSDDECGVEILQKIPALAYGLNNPAEVFAIDVKENRYGMEFIINAFDQIERVKINLIGIFNLYNFLAGCTLALKEGIELKRIVEVSENLIPVSGRCELVGEKNGGLIYIDYAHTPQGLNNLLFTLKKVCKGSLICLFGCGGNRDKEKRKIMGQISGKNADFTVITTDNPRFEEPYQIIDQIENGVREYSRKYITIQNRKTAIEYAINKLGKNDILVLAGKGSEEYQEIMGTKHKFSDKKIVAEILGENV